MKCFWCDDWNQGQFQFRIVNGETIGWHRECMNKFKAKMTKFSILVEILEEEESNARTQIPEKAIRS